METQERAGGFRRFGPAIIVAAVVCGPGSILTASKTGANYGFGMVWVLGLAVVLMVGATALAAYIGTVSKGTPGDELAARLGRPVAFLVGAIIFLVAAGFQTSNNLAVMAAVAPYFEPGSAGAKWVPVGCVVLLNVGLIVLVYVARQLYRPVEKAMKALVLLMVLAFLVNLVVVFFTPGDSGEKVSKVVTDPGALGFLGVVGLMATTFSVAGAFYQAYLVRGKGWGISDLRRGTADSIFGIMVLGLITLVIMLTAAIHFHGKVDGNSLKSVTDVAAQLEGLFGSWAGIVFTVGIFAGALSSFLVNSMIGGQFLADGMGKGGSMDAAWARHGTAIALSVGMVAGLFAYLGVPASEQSSVAPIIVAQASTVLGGPVLALALLYLGTRKRDGVPNAPGWAVGLTAVGFLVTLVLAYRTGGSLWAKFAG